MMNKILEAKDLELFKRLLRILGEYSKSVPATGMDRLFDAVIEYGKKVMPKDKTAIAILDKILKEDAVADTVQKLMNMRFSSLPVDCRPLIKKGRRHEVASWTRGELTSDRVKDLIDWSGKGGTGKWTTVEGETAQLVDMTSKEEK